MVKQSSTRVSLVRFFGIALTIIVSLFLLVSWLTFSRLLNFESILNNISDRALPKIALSSELYGETSKLLEFTNLLANSTSDAGKRVAEQQLNTYIRNIKNLSDKKLENQFLDTQLDIINIELLEFSNLIWQRSNIQKQLKINKDSMYSIFLEAFRLPTKQGASADAQLQEKSWRIELPQLMILAGQALSTHRLQLARGYFSDFSEKLTQLKNVLGNNPNTVQKRLLIERLEYLVFADNGLQSLLISQLKLDGRVMGRENFMHHIIVDFSRLLEISARETKDNVFNQVSISVEKTKQQTNLIGLAIATAILLLFGVLFLIQQKILKRLQYFNLIVGDKTKGTQYKLLLRGNDEITDLAKTFHELTNTIEIQKQQLEQMSMTDSLTGVANRLALDRRLQHDIELSIRQKSSVSVLLLDIDYFKLYNDKYGHEAGNECLKYVAEVISSSLHRQSDFVARFAGEQFLCVLPNTDVIGAENIAKQIIQALALRNIPHEFSEVSTSVTTSIGVAESNSSHILQPEKLIQQANKALDTAKEAGKNSYKTYSDNLQN
ncbi:GGDEF domain-containing protein [Paraglaciecola sp. L3A3]|uniref:GGDEF domain-containing protein n=1 Tax=Paraglaciecola sp. L3A3 TaxID=2686358 RepID=UPI00131E5E96|nr:GGDEF domain-containing protein [Paraglaciecola sp. L3A3]